ncbi:hypothetical protein [Amycolatopsis sp. H20-H5]|uniref:hypothetical protein n=1 Tax=Amycolatopsis sp. H20-H5 TaxID=3046309 RepID=UPI002DB6E460|nr:hypothetical protein [Amycolatopsis sp. H20-H5]MEC3978329.1 hypothetical protein [Amycolatopsis sp. H20-H5]
MADTVSLPLGFDVPAGWTPVDPAKAGAPGAVFVAVHAGGHDEFIPNITLSVRQRPDAATIAAIADEAIERLGRSMAGLDVVSRQEVGDAGAPGLTQVLRLRTGEGLDLVQTQVHLTVPAQDPAGRIVLEIACTATPGRARELAEDFQRFVGTVRLRRDVPTEEGETP